MSRKFTQARAEMRKIGITLSYDDDLEEYRVNFHDGTEATAYYTDDLEDAVDTGKAMSGLRSE